MALVAQAPNGDASIPVEDAHRAMRALQGDHATEFSVKAFYPKNFLFTFYTQAARDRAFAAGSIPVRGRTLVLWQWTRLAHASPSTLLYKVIVEMEGIPPHAWSVATAWQILGSSCWIEKLDPAMESKIDISRFKLTASTDNPDTVPKTHSSDRMNLIFGNLLPYLVEEGGADIQGARSPSMCHRLWQI